MFRATLDAAQDLEGNFAVQAAIFGEIDLSHTSLAYFLKNLVMTNGRADHTILPHCAVQLGPMLRREAAKDNGKRPLNVYPVSESGTDKDRELRDS